MNNSMELFGDPVDPSGSYLYQVWSRYGPFPEAPPHILAKSSHLERQSNISEWLTGHDILA